MQSRCRIAAAAPPHITLETDLSRFRDGCSTHRAPECPTLITVAVAVAVVLAVAAAAAAATTTTAAATSGHAPRAIDARRNPESFLEGRSKGDPTGVQ